MNTGPGNRGPAFPGRCFWIPAFAGMTAEGGSASCKDSHKGEETILV